MIMAISFAVMIIFNPVWMTACMYYMYWQIDSTAVLLKRQNGLIIKGRRLFRSLLVLSWSSLSRKFFGGHQLSVIQKNQPKKTHLAFPENPFLGSFPLQHIHILEDQCHNVIRVLWNGTRWHKSNLSKQNSGPCILRPPSS